MGKRIYNSNRKVTNLFFDVIRKNLKKKIIIIPEKKYYKDFILADDFSRIIYLSIKRNISGVFNLSSNKKIYLKDLAKWISNKTDAKILYSKNESDSFTLNNYKLLNKLRMRIKFLNLRKEIMKII